MSKKVLYGLLIILSVLILTGCGKDDNQNKLGRIQYVPFDNVSKIFLTS